MSLMLGSPEKSGVNENRHHGNAWRLPRNRWFESGIPPATSLRTFGYYDSGLIQPLDFFGDGPRVPLVVVSPYAKDLLLRRIAPAGMAPDFGLVAQPLDRVVTSRKGGS